MKTLLDKATIHKIQQQVMQKMKRAYPFARSIYQRLNKRQRMMLAIMGAVILLLLLVMIFTVGTEKSPREKSTPPIRFETRPTDSHPIAVIAKQSQPVTTHDTKLQAELDQLKAVSSTNYGTVQKQLQAIQSNLATLASQRDVQQLRQTVSQPNTELQGQVNRLQQSVEKMVKQTEQQSWVNPQSVERYFKLVAVQGFSDGMRAIIDVDGNQTALSVKQICPACRGWVVQSMDFTHQRAVFTKRIPHQVLYVTLHAN